MMRLPDRFVEDRALRDAARAVLEADLAHIKDSLAERSVASRVTSGLTATISSRISDGARDVFEEARQQASDHRGVLAVLIGAIILWLARDPIFAWLGSGEGENETEAHGDEAAAEVAQASDGDGVATPAPPAPPLHQGEPA